MSFNIIFHDHNICPTSTPVLCVNLWDDSENFLAAIYLPKQLNLIMSETICIKVGSLSFYTCSYN